jgi:hypothetical protein
MPKQGRYKVSLYSSDARLIKRWLIMGADSSLDISNLFNGLYLVSIEDEHSIKFLNFIKQ